MPIVNKKELIDLATPLGIKVLQGYAGSEQNVHIPSLSINDFLALAKTYDAKAVFYSEKVVLRSDIYIDGDTYAFSNNRSVTDLELRPDFDWYLDLCLYPEESRIEYEEDIDDDESFEEYVQKANEMFKGTVEEAIKDEIVEYDNSLDMSIIDKPTEIKIFFVSNGYCFYTQYTEEIVTEDMTADKQLGKIFEKYSELIKLAKEKEELCRSQKEAEQDALKKQIREKLLSDIEFKCCSNARSRHEYLEEFLRKPENKEILIVFGGKRKAAYNLSNFFDRIYNEYKILKSEGKA